VNLWELRSAVRLALADFAFEWRLSSCLVLALAAVLAPLLVLFGLKYGIVEAIRGPMLENPLYRQVSPVGSGHFSTQWFQQMQAHPAVGFVVPRTRSISATVDLRNRNGPRTVVTAELIPTAAGDPVLTADLLARIQGRATNIVLSSEAAQKLGVEAGGSIEAFVTRSRDGRQERARLSLTVLGVASDSAFGRAGLFAPLALLEAVEDYRDGRAVPAFKWRGSAQREEANRDYASYRLYAKSLQDVAPLREGLQAAGLSVRTRAADIEVLQSLDRNLTLIFWIIAGIGAFGYLLSFGASLWSLVERKRKELSVLRLLGVRPAALVCFPITHAVALAVVGSAVAIGAALGISVLLNSLFAESTSTGQFVCRLQVVHLAGAATTTLVGAVFASALAAYRSTLIDPAEGLRDV
jgi:putative ABC transport system permease protein